MGEKWLGAVAFRGERQPLPEPRHGPWPSPPKPHVSVPPCTPRIGDWAVEHPGEGCHVFTPRAQSRLVCVGGKQRITNSGILLDLQPVLRGRNAVTMDRHLLNGARAVKTLLVPATGLREQQAPHIPGFSFQNRQRSEQAQSSSDSCG